MKKTKRIIAGLLVAGVLVTALAVQDWTGESVEAYNRENLIRFHIVPNSDDAADQLLKHRVRKAVVEAVSPLVGGLNDAGEAGRVIRENLTLVQRVSENEVAAAGKDYPVEVAFGKWWFPTRSYDGLTLAAGEYQAVRVTIGAGTGANWWCVLFPPLCFVNGEAGPGLADPDGALATIDTPGPHRLEMRLKLAEVWERSSALATQLAEQLALRDKEKRSWF
ncbi:MAG: stage II sporulation protein R [Candidatus Desulforudis sp.]|nr:stage II sporulation protein R [Desulforudis sp.]